jgi:hypothetical protein
MDAAIRGYTSYEIGPDGLPKPVKPVKPVARTKRPKPFATEWELLNQLGLDRRREPRAR